MSNSPWILENFELIQAANNSTLKGIQKDTQQGGQRMGGKSVTIP